MRAREGCKSRYEMTTNGRDLASTTKTASNRSETIRSRKSFEREWMGIEPTWRLFSRHTGFEAQRRKVGNSGLTTGYGIAKQRLTVWLTGIASE